MQDEINQAIDAERERCARLCEELARRWEARAVKLREDGSYQGGWLWRKKCVRPKWEEPAKNMEAAAGGLHTIARGIREGWEIK